MRVLKQGVPPEQHTFRATCTRCTCEYEFQRHEAEVLYDQREGDCLTTKCPTCRSTVYTSMKARVYGDHR